MLVDAAVAGERHLSRIVFTGTEPDSLHEVTAFIGLEIPRDSRALGPAGNGRSVFRDLAALRSWPLSMAYFPAGSADAQPDFEIAFRLLENGVASDLVLDYNDFRDAGGAGRVRVSPPARVLTGVTWLPIRACPAGRHRRRRSASRRRSRAADSAVPSASRRNRRRPAATMTSARRVGEASVAERVRKRKSWLFSLRTTVRPARPWRSRRSATRAASRSRTVSNVAAWAVSASNVVSAETLFASPRASTLRSSTPAA